MDGVFWKYLIKVGENQIKNSKFILEGAGISFLLHVLKWGTLILFYCPGLSLKNKAFVLFLLKSLQLGRQAGRVTLGFTEYLHVQCA